MRKFRDKEVKGWVLVSAWDQREFIAELNDLMDKYEFIDTQYSMHDRMFTALVLIAERPRETIVREEINITEKETNEKLDKIRENIKKLSKDLEYDVM